jgi:hypothetical protein
MTEKLKSAFKSIIRYIRYKPPETLEEAKSRLAVIDQIATDAIAEIEEKSVKRIK